MSYCLNPSCPKPINRPKSKTCQACGSNLLLRKRYNLVKGLGKGGFGATFLAADMSLPGNPLCVIKQLKPNTDNPNFLVMARQLFEREARTLGKVGNHPQIPRLLDYFEDRQQFYLVQEFVKGNNLQQEVKKNGVLNEEKAQQVLKEILIILKDIHSQKVIHRDIKPANIIRREIDDKLVLIDFGVVKNQVNSAAANSDQTALTAFAVGTPGFAPPEQLAMRPVYSSDLYALGITCMYLMTGKAPKNMPCDPITGEIDWFKNVSVSNEFAEILLTMIEVAVKNRYKTADKVLQELDLINHTDDLATSMTTSFMTNSQPTSRFSNSRGVSSTRSRGSMSSSIGTNRSRSSRFGNTNGRSRMGNTSSLNNTRSSAIGSTRSQNKRSLSKVHNRKKQSSENKKPVKIEAKDLLEEYSNGRRDFTLKDISLHKLQKVDLSGSNFQNSRIIRTNFQGGNLSSVDFTKCDLRQSVFRNANLGRAYLNSANLEAADLRGADLSYTNLERANLKDANLSGANLSHASVTEEQLSLAKTGWTTIFPSGKRGLWK